MRYALLRKKSPTPVPVAFRVGSIISAAKPRAPEGARAPDRPAGSLGGAAWRGSLGHVTIDPPRSGVQAMPGPTWPLRAAPKERLDGGAIQEAAARGIAGRGRALPHGETIQRAFGRHDVRGIASHIGGDAEAAGHAIGAKAYTVGNHVAFSSAPGLHMAAHEAAHVIQQRGGIRLEGGVGSAG